MMLTRTVQKAREFMAHVGVDHPRAMIEYVKRIQALCVGVTLGCGRREPGRPASVRAPQ